MVEVVVADDLITVKDLLAIEIKDLIDGHTTTIEVQTRRKLNVQTIDKTVIAADRLQDRTTTTEELDRAPTITDPEEIGSEVVVEARNRGSSNKHPFTP